MQEPKESEEFAMQSIQSLTAWFAWGQGGPPRSLAELTGCEQGDLWKSIGLAFAPV